MSCAFFSTVRAKQSPDYRASERSSSSSRSSLFININCSHEAGLQVQRNTLINNTMCKAGLTQRFLVRYFRQRM